MHSEARALWLEEWANRISALNLSPVVLPLIEVACAFGFLGNQALLLTRPLMSGIVRETAIERLAVLLDNPDLLRRLEEQLQEES